MPVKIRNIVTASAIRNATRVALAVCGSTNSALHLPAIAHEADVDYSWEDYDELSQKRLRKRARPVTKNMCPEIEHGDQFQRRDFRSTL